MKRSLERANAEATGAKRYLLAAYYFLANNMSIMAVLVGIAMMAFGATVLSGRPGFLFGPDGPLNALVHGVFAGMFGLWGATIVLLGILAYAALWLNQFLARVQTDSSTESDGDTRARIRSRRRTQLLLVPPGTGPEDGAAP